MDTQRFFQISNVALAALLGLATSFAPEIASKSSAHIQPEKTSEISSTKQRQSISSQLSTLSGVWDGSYICGQGLTRLRLLIDARSTTEISAQFVFSAHPDNPGVPSGWFSMEGTYQVVGLDGVPNMVELNATDWVERPSGYGTVDLVGTLFLHEGFEAPRLIGNVTNNRCSTFDVERISSLEELE